MPAGLVTATLLVLRQASFLPAFRANEQLRALIRSGKIELVLWDHLGECEGPPHMRCWQPLVYSHAILEAWGTDVYLLITDIDEFFVLPNRGDSLANAIANCTGGKPMVRGVSRVCCLLVCT